MFANFGETIFRTIYEYKKILKRHLSAEQYRDKVNALGIKRKQLRTMSEVALYKLASSILKDLENYKTKDYPSLYSGIHEFINHIKHILKNYHLEDQTVVHSSQTASQKIVEMIQVISLCEEGVDSGILYQLNACTETIIKYGTLEQLDMIINLLKQQQKEGKKFFAAILERLEAHFQKILRDPAL